MLSRFNCCQLLINGATDSSLLDKEISVNKINYLNAGCGAKFHPAWTNIDMGSNSPYVYAYNFLNGFPYEDNQFDVVYHSQVLEHFPKEKAGVFLSECLRVLRPGGILRVVVPDLENIVSEYLRLLRENLEAPSKQSTANYDWMLLEMYDQTVRNHSGGQMAVFLTQPELPNEQYIVERIGYVGQSLINSVRANIQPVAPSPEIAESITPTKALVTVGYSTRLIRFMKRSLFKLLRPTQRVADAEVETEASRIGRFRLAGEVHMWMYDQFSLTRLLSQSGYEKVVRLDPYKSGIPDWYIYELDVKDDLVFDPTSLFMEARKPLG
jgi:predicted SAM-dependent methyltransferase